MGKLDRSEIRTATRLLAKAESTDSDDEAIALALRSYSLLAEVINAYDLAHEDLPKGARRRERRHIPDRRAVQRPAADPTSPGEEPESVADNYARLGAERHSEGAIDCSL